MEPLDKGHDLKQTLLYGAIQKVCHRPRGGGGSSKIVTKSDKGGGGSSKTVMSPLIHFQEKFPLRTIPCVHHKLMLSGYPKLLSTRP